MRFAHRPAYRGQRFALPTAQAFAHKLHSLPPPSMKPEPQRLRSYRGDKYCDAGGGAVSRPVPEFLPVLIAQDHRCTSVRLEFPNLVDRARRPAPGNGS